MVTPRQLPPGESPWGTPAPQPSTDRDPQLPTRSGAHAEPATRHASATASVNTVSPAPVSAPTPTKVPPEQMYLPEGVEPPTMGLPARRWKRNLRKGKSVKGDPYTFDVPKPNRQEQELRARQKAEAEARYQEAMFWVRMAWLITRLQGLVNTKGLRVNILVRNIKGHSGKTARAFGIANAVSRFGGKPMLLMTSTLLTSIADTATMSGIPKSQWVRLADVDANLEKIETPRDFADFVPTNNCGTFVICEDKDENNPGRTLLTTERMFQIIDRFEPLVYAGMVFDSGQDKIGNDFFVFGLADRATVIVFSALADSPKSREKMSVSIEGLQTAPSEFPTRLGRVPASIQERVAKSILVVNGVKDGDVIDFDDEFLSPDDETEAANKPTPPPFEGVRLTVPREPTLLETAGKKIAYDSYRIGWPTLMADLECAVACFQQGAKILKIDTNDVDTLVPDFVMASRLLGVDITQYEPYWQDNLEFTIGLDR